MNETKQKITFKSPEYQTLKFDIYTVSVKPFLSLVDQMAIMAVYLDEYFSGGQSRVLEAEYKLVLSVIDLCTNVDISELRIDSLLGNYKLWEEIKSKIKNYGEFRALLAKTVEEIKQAKMLEKTLGSAIEGLLEKLNSILTTDISPESIEKTKEMLKMIEESKILKTATEIYKKEK